MLKGAFYFFLKASSMLGFSFSFFFLIAGWGTSRSVGICGRLCRAGTVPGVRMAIRAAAAGRPCRTDGSASRACGWRCRAGTVLGWVCADDYVLREGCRGRVCERRLRTAMPCGKGARDLRTLMETKASRHTLRSQISLRTKAFDR